MAYSLADSRLDGRAVEIVGNFLRPVVFKSHVSGLSEKKQREPSILVVIWQGRF